MGFFLIKSRMRNVINFNVSTKKAVRSKYRTYFAGSYNGSTADSESAYYGSNPYPAADFDK